MSSSSCCESTDEEEDNAPFTCIFPSNLHTPSIVQLVNLSIAIMDDSEVNTNTKTAAQIFLEEAEVKNTVRKRAQLKLALLQQEVQLGNQLLQQKKTLATSKQEPQLLCKSRIKFVKRHKFWRGAPIAALYSSVAETVRAAKSRLQMGRRQFNQVEMLAAIDKLAPEGIYLSKNPSHPATSRSCPGRWYVPRRVESLATQTLIQPPQLFKEIERASRQHRQSAAGYRGDQSIVSHPGDAIVQEPLYDPFTQTEPCLSDHYAEQWEDQGYCCDDSICIDEAWDDEYDHVVYSEDEYEFSTSDISEEQELITDISVEASDSLCYDTDGNLYY